MKKKYRSILIATIILILGSGYFYFNTSDDLSTDLDVQREELKKARDDYFFEITKDPATNSIPENIRAKEYEFSKSLAKKSLSKKQSNFYNWKSAGPIDVGGRTRAFAIDVTNSNTIIAGGVSGGIWKSTNGGSTWVMKSTKQQRLSVTSIAQDKRTGHTNTWYYSTGEFSGNSASDRGYKARFYGDAIYKSTDNGETWQPIANTSVSHTSWNSNFNYVSKIGVSITTGSIFIASNGFGIYKSTDGGDTFTLVLGRANDHYYNEFDIAPNGNIMVTLSEYGYNNSNGTGQLNSPGVYFSSDDGANWENITPSKGYPSKTETGNAFRRAIPAFAPSNPDIAYVLVYANANKTAVTGSNASGGEISDVRLFKYYRTANIWINRSNNMPDFTAESNSYSKYGFVDPQGSYNLSLAVKPDDENFIVIAGTSVFRSTNGFSTASTDSRECWIGGYNDVNFFDDGSHPDIHAIVFDPQIPNRMYLGTDGGVYMASDITITKSSYLNGGTSFPWVDKNIGYIVTQHYTVSIPNIAGDNRIMGGAQDNGTPEFTFDGTNTSYSEDVSSGDGTYCYYGSSYAYVSTQNGRLRRKEYDAQGNIYWGSNSGSVWPAAATGQKFVNPFFIDPISENVIYYAGGQYVWRNSSINTVAGSGNGISSGWVQLTGMALPTGYKVSSMGISKNNNYHVLYFAGYKSGSAPVLYRLENSNTATTGAVDISIAGAASGAYTHSISVNPNNSNEILVVLSNYNIIGLYHSTDGGANFTAVEGNLEGDGSNPGPSIRSANIVSSPKGTFYFVGTSIGLFSASSLNGNSTTWTQESPNDLGNVVVEYVTSRDSDYRVAVGSHGRGIYIGYPGSLVNVEDTETIPTEFSLSQNYPNPFNPSTVINFSLPSSSNTKLQIFDVTGKLVKTIVDENLVKGQHSYVWNANNNSGSKVASGVYLYSLITDKNVQTKKMVLLK